MQYLEVFLLIAPMLLFYLAYKSLTRMNVVLHMYRLCAGALACIIFYSWMINIGFIEALFESESLLIGHSFSSSLLSFSAIALYIAAYDLLTVLDRKLGRES